MMDVSGKRFGMLTAVKQLANQRYKNGQLFYVWECKCDCGNTTSVKLGNLRSGHTTSCGCWRRESRFTHRMAKTRLHKVWIGMKNRCNLATNTNYRLYGGKGVAVCAEWNKNFLAFHDWAIENGYDENAAQGKCTIDRIDPNGNYEPSNCRIVDMVVQSNNRTNSRLITAHGETDTVANMARKHNIRDRTIRSRLNRGWDEEKAVRTPVRK